MASNTLDLAALDRLAALERAATPRPWGWNSYSGIAAKVPEGHPLEDYEEDDPGDRGMAWICWIDGGPKQKGHGDDLIVGEARKNAALIEELRNAAPALIALARAGLAAQAEVARLSGILTTLEGAVEDALEAAGAAQKRVNDGK